MPAIEVSEDLLDRVRKAMKLIGIQNESEFVEWAVEANLEASRIRLLDELSSRIRAKMDAKGVTEEDILADFEKWRHASNRS